jgi:hypothetical protein
MFDKNEGRVTGLVFELQISEMFEMHENERKISFLVVVCDLDGSSQPKPTFAISTQGQMGSFLGCNMSEKPDQSDNIDEHWDSMR